MNEENTISEKEKILENNKKFLKNYINENCIFRCPPGYYLEDNLPGKKLSWDFYLKKAIYHQDSLYGIVEYFLSTHNPNFQYCALETTTGPILSAMQLLGKIKGINVEGFVLRKEPKKFSLKNIIEGDILEKPIIMLDLIVNSRNNIDRVKDIANKLGLECKIIKAIINKQMVNEYNGLKIESLFLVNEFAMSWDSYYTKKISEEEIIKFINSYPSDVLGKF